jgi:hypothetical protein
MTSNQRTLVKIMSTVLIIVLFAFAYMAWQKQQLTELKEERASKYAQLKELLQKAAKLDRQITEQDRIYMQAEKQGFFEPFSARKFAAKLKRLACDCGIQDIVLTFNASGKALKKASVQPVTVVLKAEWDQDIYRFVYRLENEGCGVIHIQELNLFRQPRAESAPDVVHAEIKFDVISIN